MPNLYVIAGGNGAGKTTIAKALLPKYFNCNEFVNADILAAGMSPEDVSKVAITAGKMTLTLIDKLCDDQISFAIETTLSGRVHERIIKKAQARNYYVVLIYVWVKSARTSIARVKDRVAIGGHFVDPGDVARRYKRGLLNLFDIFMDLCDYWVVLDNAKLTQKIVAEGTSTVEFNVAIPEIWKKMKSAYKTYKRYGTGS